MRKRAQRRSITTEEPKHIAAKMETETKSSYFKKNWWVAVSLVCIFLLVLFLNTYFNISSGETFNAQGQGLDKYYLSGPDPYYNMRLVNQTLYGEAPNGTNAGYYPYYSNIDPLLNYPIGRSGARPPLLNMLAIGFSKLLVPFMNEVDAVGYSMQFVPALFGALLIFPVYFLGETLFGKKAGLVAAFLIALIPVHISSGHGSAFTLFDHDSLNLLLYFLAFLFVIKGIKEKDMIKSILCALLAGVCLGALSMVWVEGQFLYAIIAVYAVVQMFIDIFLNKMEMKVPITALVALSSGYLISLPIRLAPVGGFTADIPLFLCLGLAAFTLIYFISNRKKIPWTISLPTIFGVAIIALVFLYFINTISSIIPIFSRLSQLSNIIYGTGIYGNKVAMTIAEASTYNISHTVMSFGPTLYWLAWAGFIFLIYYYYKNKQRRDYLFILILFIVDIWLTGVAGRFINDLVPLIALLSGWVVWIVAEKIDYKQMIRNIKSAGGGFHGLRRGIKFLHIVGILFITFLVILPNVYISFDAAVPVNEKTKLFGSDTQGAFGLTSGKEAYWVDAYNWFNSQDNDIANPSKRPAYISWWDYGFYEVALGGHPTVADNFQDGIPPAANFHTATSEKEAISVWITRLLEGEASSNSGRLTDGIKFVLRKHLGENDSKNITTWIETGISPSSGTPIGEKYNEELSKDWLVGAQYGENAYYHDIVTLLANYSDEQVTWLYHDVQDVTGHSIRYYGVEGYDKQIFNIFGFLSDKSLLMVAISAGNPEDDFEKVIFVGYKINTDGTKGADAEWSYEDLMNMPKEERDYIAITSTKPIYKDAYFDTMFYRTYVGISTGSSGSKQEPDYQIPCMDMRHFTAEYISPYAYYTAKSAVVIAKYYEGAYVNGSVTFLGEPLAAQVVVTKAVDHQLYREILRENYTLQYPAIDHDKTTTNDTGEFNLIAPAGNITIQIRRNTELGGNAFVLKNVTFDSTTDPELHPISDAEAMRKYGTNYERILKISIDPANIEGYVYQNEDEKNEYDPLVDQPLPNTDITLYEIEQFDSQTGNINSVSSIKTLTTDENGRYNTSDLMPGFYLIRATLDDFVIYENYIKIYSGNNFYNISKPKPAAVEGKTYYDTNKNGKCDAGEEIGNAEVSLLYNTLEGNQKPIDKITTNANGDYSFSSLIPGSYTLKATKINAVTGHLDYDTSEDITLKENQTTSFNISMTLAKVKLSGYTKYDGENLGYVDIIFKPDGGVEGNTAVQSNTASNITTGYYEIQLTPGSYNVSATKKIGQMTIYSYDGKLEIVKGENAKTSDISMNKVSATTSGTVTYGNEDIDNVSVVFTPDATVANNTAKLNAVISNVNGYEIELMPGSYVVTADKEANEEGQNVTYTFSGELVIKDTDVDNPVTFNIVLTRTVD